jgi:hypothetical protein
VGLDSCKIAGLDNQYQLKNKSGQVTKKKKFYIFQQLVGQTGGLINQYRAQANPQKPRAKKNSNAYIVAFEAG